MKQFRKKLIALIQLLAVFCPSWTVEDLTTGTRVVDIWSLHGHVEPLHLPLAWWCQAIPCGCGHLPDGHAWLGQWGEETCSGCWAVLWAAASAGQPLIFTPYEVGRPLTIGIHLRCFDWRHKSNRRQLINHYIPTWTYHNLLSHIFKFWDYL